MGRDWYSVQMALAAWGEKWLVDEGPSVTYQHQACGKTVRPVVVCSECGEKLDPREISAIPSAEIAGTEADDDE
jgi:hypothetical protein